MKVIHDKSGEYPDVINSYYDLEAYSDDDGVSVLFQGYNSSKASQKRDEFLSYQNRVYLNLESPCAFCSTNTFLEEQKFFTHTYTICPYTLKWLNKKIGTKGEAIAFPYSKNCFSHLDWSIKDTASMYMGTIMCEEHESILKAMSSHSHFVSSLSHHPMATHIGLSSFEKWNLLARVKCSVMMNLCPITDHHKMWIKKNEGFEKHEALNNFDENFVPQFKPRVIESMVCNVVCLVKKDKWNVIENWFTPGEDFIYWETYDELQELIDDIDSNFENYIAITESARKKVEKFEIKNIIHLIKKQLK